MKANPSQDNGSVRKTGQVARRSVGLRGFTLIEVLVVVSVIALLISILLPSLQKAKEQAEKVTCIANLHQTGLGLYTYSVDHKGVLPYRGWFPYTIAEASAEALGEGGNRKVLCNLGLLYGKWVGKNWDVLYCPNLYWIRDQTNSGLSTVFDDSVRFTHGGYVYANPIISRGPRGMKPKRKGGSFPNLGDNNVYPRKYINDEYWKFLKEKQDFPAADIDNENVAPRIPKGCQALVSDWNIGLNTALVHKDSVNVLYSDSHVKSFKTVTMPGDERKFENEMWYFYNNNR